MERMVSLCETGDKIKNIEKFGGIGMKKALILDGYGTLFFTGTGSVDAAGRFWPNGGAST